MVDKQKEKIIRRKIKDLKNIVVNECFCTWGVFLDNVKSAGFDGFAEMVLSAKTVDDLRDVANTYV